MKSLVNYDKSIKKTHANHSIWVHARPLPSYFPPSNGKTRLEFTRPHRKSDRARAHVLGGRGGGGGLGRLQPRRGKCVREGTRARTRHSSCTTAGKHTGRVFSQLGQGNCFLNMLMVLGCEGEGRGVGFCTWNKDN